MPGKPDNRRIVTGFATAFYTDRDVRRAFESFVAAEYIQHNPTIADGRDAAVAALADKFATGGAEFDVQRILVDGDYALVHVRASFPGRPVAAVADIYRLADGKIVEHWDVLQSMPEQVANEHPMF